MKEFITSAKRAEGEQRETLKFKHDGREITSKRPSDTQVAMLMASMGGYRNESDTIAGIIDFLVNIMEEQDGRYFALRLMDGDDDFELDDVQEIVFWLIEEWSDRPSKPSSDSTPSSATNGDGSTATSDSAASATSTSKSLAPAT